MRATGAAILHVRVRDRAAATPTTRGRHATRRLMSCIIPNVRGPSWGHPNGEEPRPVRQQRAAEHRRPEVRRRRRAGRCQWRCVAPNSSRASHDATRDANPSPDDPTMPTPASTPTCSLKKRRSRPRRSRPARGKRCFAWSLLLIGLGTRRSRTAIRLREDWATRAASPAAAIRVVVAPAWARAGRCDDAATQHQSQSGQQRILDRTFHL